MAYSSAVPLDSADADIALSEPLPLDRIERLDVREDFTVGGAVVGGAFGFGLVTAITVALVSDPDGGGGLGSVSIPVYLFSSAFVGGMGAAFGAALGSGVEFWDPIYRTP